MSGRELQAIFAGFGGQGVLFAGKTVAYAGLLEGREVSWLPSYGPEMRGGTANCSVTLSDDPIGSPLVMHPNVLVAMNQPSYDKFASELADGGIIVYDDALVTPGTELEGAHGIAATSLAEQAGLDGLMNMVLVGYLWAHDHFCDRDSLDAAVEKCVSAMRAHLIQKNKEAIALGVQAAQRV